MCSVHVCTVSAPSAPNVTYTALHQCPCLCQSIMQPFSLPSSSQISFSCLFYFLQSSMPKTLNAFQTSLQKPTSHSLSLLVLNSLQAKMRRYGNTAALQYEKSPPGDSNYLFTLLKKPCNIQKLVSLESVQLMPDSNTLTHM